MSTRLEQVSAWVLDHLREQVVVSGISDLGGHSGNTVRVDLDGGRAALVIRFAPTTSRGSHTDVLRQAPLLRALAAAGVPVAPVVAAVDDERWFGTAALVQELLPGRPATMFPRTPGSSGSRDAVRKAAVALAALHRVDHATALPHWAEPLSPTDTVHRWTRLVPRMDEEAWRPAAEVLAEELLARAPAEAHLGVLHGDLQTNNVLYADDGELLAIIDWELAGIGPTALDVAWLAMMHDLASWGDPLRDRLAVTAEPAEVLRWYADAGGPGVADPDWYLALACFRYAVIAAYNVRLHRTGRRVDPFNELMAGTVPVLLARGATVLHGR